MQPILSARPRVIVAPDKFKGSLTAPEAALALAAGVRQYWPAAQVTTLPLADGGEGTVDAALAAGAEERCARVVGPLGEEVWARWALFRSPTGEAGTAVIESAQASGLAQVKPNPDAARSAHSFGCGQLIQAALHVHAKDIVLGLGGSAMTDGGSGALRALGLKVLAYDGSPVPLGGAGLLSARRLDVSGLDRRLQSVRLRLAVDVQNPLYGPFGAAHVFAAQKGADPEGRHELDQALRHWASLLQPKAPDLRFIGPGSGAAGGFPSGFLALTAARLERGFDLISDLVGFEELLTGADLLVVGEGSMDSQSLQGKAPLAAAARAAARGVPVVAVAGQLSLMTSELVSVGVRSSASVAECAPSLEAALSEARLYAGQATVKALRRLMEGPADPSRANRQTDPLPVASPDIAARVM